MKRIRVSILLAAVLLLTQAVGNAQTQTRRLSVNPKSDESAMQLMRERMKRIRNKEKRPTVALVLSGGGAKGAAHVGVLRYLEEQQIPVDIVLGTSMGGLVGGLYALGYSPAFMDSLLRTSDWSILMSDKVPREYISYSNVKYKEKFALSFPFSITRDLHLGAGEDDGSQNSLRDNIMRSLPSGYIFGQNVANKFSSLSVGYEDRMNFFDLPIPFVCVATDLVSCRAKIWHDGKITTAMRSTMSIPGVFAPVKTEGMVLVDGGMRNNFPTDIAHEMGADIIIGVELSDSSMSYDDINNLGDLIWQSIDLMGYDTFASNVNMTDVFIKPRLAGYNMMSFDSVSIDTIINRGYQAAVAQAESIAQVQKRTGRREKKLAAPPATDIMTHPVTIDRLTFTGLDETEIQHISKKIDLKVGRNVTGAMIEDAVAKIYAIGAYNYVNYELSGSEEPYKLDIKCQHGPVNRLGLGARFDSETLVSAIFNVGINVNALSRHALDVTAKVAANPYLDLHYIMNTRHGNTLNADLLFSYTDANMFDMADSRYNINYWRLRQRLYFSNMSWSNFDVKLGLRNDWFKTVSFLGQDTGSGRYSGEKSKNDYVSIFADGRHDSTDDGYFPHRGSDTRLRAGWIFTDRRNVTKSLLELQLDHKSVIPTRGMLDLLLSINARATIGNNVPLPYMNVIGGSMPGKYVDQQIPFMGINYAMPVERLLAVMGIEARLDLGKNHYLSAVANCMGTADNPDSIDRGRMGVGAGLEYAYDSIIGPLKINLHWSDLTKRVGLYCGIGFDF
ncbi:MAG: patatin-like phospholipase family protein [Bacteroidia bacterium]|nr:patatin-like phospholipase family protein [Bacteroidia bacterium]